MEIILLVLFLVVVGVIIGALAGVIWKGHRPYGTSGDYILSIISALAVGFLDWYIIPAMGFSDTMKYLGVALEPALTALIVLWVVRLAKKS